MYSTKDVLRVVVVMKDLLVEGDIHVLVGSRLTDSLNSKAKDFIALTHARIRRLGDDTVVYEPAYMAINRESIAAIFPLDDEA